MGEHPWGARALNDRGGDERKGGLAILCHPRPVGDILVPLGGVGGGGGPLTMVSRWTGRSDLSRGGALSTRQGGLLLSEGFGWEREMKIVC